MDDGEEQDKRMTRWHRFIQSYQTEFATEVNYITPPACVLDGYINQVYMEFTKINLGRAAHDEK